MGAVYLFYHEEDAKEWCGYLKDILEGEALKRTVHAHEVTSESTRLKQYVDRKFPISILLSPCMLCNVKENRTEFWKVLKQHPKVIVLLCSVDEQDFDEEFSNYPYIKNWKVKSLGNNTKDVTVAMTTLYKLTQIPVHKKTLQTQIPTHFELFPSQIHQPNSRIAIVFHDQVNGSVHASCGAHSVILKKENSCTFVFVVPAVEPGKNKVVVTVNKKCCGTRILTYIPPPLVAFECLEFIKQTLGVQSGDREELDERLATLYENSLPGDNSLDKIISNMEHNHERSNLQTPTLLHFAAKHGLSQLCSVVLNTPGSLSAYGIDNVDGLSAMDLAEQAGYKELAEYIRLFFDTEVVVQAVDALYENTAGLGTKTEAEKPSASCPLRQDVDSRRQCLLPQKDVCSTQEASKPVLLQTELKAYDSHVLSSLTDLAELNKSVADGEFTIEEGIRLCDSWKQRTKFARSVKDNQENIKKIRSQYEEVFKAANTSKGIFGMFRNRFKSKQKEVDIRISHPTPVDTGAYTTVALLSADRLSSASSTSSSSYSSRDSHLSNYSRDSSLGTSIDERGEDDPQFQEDDEDQYYSSRSQLQQDSGAQRSSNPPPLPPRKRNT